jgi:hypothetical protein
MRLPRLAIEEVGLLSLEVAVSRDKSHGAGRMAQALTAGGKLTVPPTRVSIGDLGPGLSAYGWAAGREEIGLCKAIRDTLIAELAKSQCIEAVGERQILARRSDLPYRPCAVLRIEGKGPAAIPDRIGMSDC